VFVKRDLVFVKRDLVSVKRDYISDQHLQGQCPYIDSAFNRKCSVGVPYSLSLSLSLSRERERERGRENSEGLLYKGPRDRTFQNL